MKTILTAFYMHILNSDWSKTSQFSLAPTHAHFPASHKALSTYWILTEVRPPSSLWFLLLLTSFPLPRSIPTFMSFGFSLRPTDFNYSRLCEHGFYLNGLETNFPGDKLRHNCFRLLNFKLRRKIESIGYLETPTSGKRSRIVSIDGSKNKRFQIKFCSLISNQWYLVYFWDWYLNITFLLPFSPYKLSHIHLCFSFLFMAFCFH